MNPFKKRGDRSGEQVLILDTCALIDARIIDIAKAGFIPQNIVIPQFIIAELQFLADHGDSHKRERARYGLDVIRDLQDLRRTKVTIAREQYKNIKEVDDKLIALAKQYGGMLYTTDYNLNKVAQIEGVVVLNVNELAQALRPRRLPGERVELKITQLGQDKTQGVGYLEDGTMVVVEKAGSKLGQRILVEFSRMLQTQAGKMMFAVLPENSGRKQLMEKPAKKETAIIESKISQQNRASKSKNQQQLQVQNVYHAQPQAQNKPARKKRSNNTRPENRQQHQDKKEPTNKQQVSPRARQNRRKTPEDSLFAAIERRNEN
ncbi:MAG: hypothetical protein PVI21_05445 [Candidatus Woesebacteria bacterium]|jgi:rRNA-processing protein FCF1